MGLDAVEIVLRTEELYSISIPDAEAAQVRTVGDFYQLICAKLDITPLDDPQTSSPLPTITQVDTSFSIFRRHTPLPPPPEVLPWTPQTVWDTLVAIFVDHQALEPEKIRPHARIAKDLGVD